MTGSDDIGLVSAERWCPVCPFETAGSAPNGPLLRRRLPGRCPRCGEELDGRPTNV